MSEAMATDEEIGKYIKKQREENHMTQEEVADFIHISRNGLSDIEHGKTKLSVDRAMELANVFKVTVVDIYNAGKVSEENINQTIEEINNSSRKIIKSKYIKIISFITLFFMTIVTCFLIYYFYNSYNSVKVYKVSGGSENFKTNIGLLIVSKENIHFSISVTKLGEKDVRNITLKQVKNGKEELIAKHTNANELYLVDFYNYEAYFNYDDIIEEKIELKLVVDYDGGSEEINLDVTKEYENKRIFFQKRSPMVENSSEVQHREISIPDKVLKEFELKDDAYALTKKTKDKELILIYFPDADLFILEKRYSDYYQSWYYYGISDGIYYSKYSINNELIEKNENLDKNSKLAEEFYEEYNKYFT